MVPVAELEEAVTEAMLADGSPHRAREFVAGDSRADQLAKLNERIGLAAAAGDYDTVSDLTAEARALRELPSVPAHWVLADTDRTEGDYFGSLDTDARRDYLSQHCAVYAAKTDGLVAVSISPLKP